ncbi:MAG TPA: MYXO-CTERM sorting domain-containing protein [Kofleriaceae bacterium]
MNRHRLRSALGGMCMFGWVVGVVGGGARPAAAEPAVSSPTPVVPAPSAVDGAPGRRVTVDTPIETYATPAAQVSQTIYLNRCSGGCTVHMGNNDARSNTSSIPMVTPQTPGPAFTIGEFVNDSGGVGAAADAEWAQVVQCMKEVYSPYNVAVTDVKPTSGQSYHEAIIAGLPGDIGLANDILGVAPLASNCSAIDNVISFSFANRHPPGGRVLNICWTAAQESAHAFGLDHEYSFTTGYAVNGHSACNDPMTYRTTCGGEKFFRNEDANCGETATRQCKCGATQNSHTKLLGVFGAGTPITGNPTVMLTAPASGVVLPDRAANVTLKAGAKRGVASVDLYLNGYKWATAPGTAFGLEGQPNPDQYAILFPADVPRSIVDIKVIAYDDLGSKTESAVVTATYGVPCTTATACAKGQKCEAGKCFWDPPSGKIGDDCSYAQFCESGLCTGTKDQQICTQACTPGVASTCPSDFDCLMSGPGTGVCFFSSTGGGCCSIGGDGGTVWAQLGLAAAAFGFVVRRRRR